MNKMEILNGFSGWGNGYQFTVTNRAEREIKQGKNYYLASLVQVGETMKVWAVLNKINEIVVKNFLTTPVKIFANFAPILSLPVLLFAASVKSGQNEKAAELFNQTRYAYIKLPAKIGAKTAAIFTFIADHSGTMMRVVMLASSVALMVLGNAFFGAGLLTALAYDRIDSWGFVPRRISLFMEIYMPTVSLVGIVVAGGTLLLQITSAIQLSTHVIPAAAHLINHKVDALIRRFFSLKGPSLAEVDAPLVEKKELTFDEINKILNCESNDLEINPAHCSRSSLDIGELPKSNDFDQFLTLFDQVDWESKYRFIKHKLKDDDRFHDFLLLELKKDHPNLQKSDLKDKIDDYIQLVAGKKDLSVERFVAQWTREQMVGLVNLLKGNVRVEGKQQDLDEAIQDAAILLPHIISMNNEIDKEDALLKLAIEGGKYCGRGIKRTVNELIRNIMADKLQTEHSIVDPIRDYELNILQHLQNKRNSIIQLYYKLITEKLEIPDAVAQDIHGFDMFRLYLSLGFYPVTTNERRNFKFSELVFWETYDKNRIQMYQIYRNDLEEVVKSVGDINFGIYLQKKIGSNSLLTNEQKDILLEKFTERNYGKWTFEKTHERFHNIMLVQLGVLRPKF